jgi:hypothetical protein
VKLATLSLALALALVCALPAAAKRAPTPAEKAAIASAVKGYIHQPGSPAAKDNAIVTVAVSTLDTRYGAVRLSSKSAGPSDMVLHESFGSWWVVGFGSSLGCDSAPKSVLADLRVGCTPPAGVAWIDDCGPLTSKPKTIVLACADANYEIVNLRWRGWGTATATATGSARANDCTPNCAAGQFHAYRMTATASRPTACGKARIYARLTIVYPGARPAGYGKRDVHALTC